MGDNDDTRHYQGALLEDIDHRLAAILEGQEALANVPADISRLQSDMREVKSDISTIKLALKDTNRELRNTNRKLDDTNKDLRGLRVSSDKRLRRLEEAVL